MRQTLAISAIILILFHELNGHGFGGSTYVRTPLLIRHNSSELDRRLGGHWESIEQLMEHADTQYVMSYHYNNKQCHSHKILARARSTANCYFTINLDSHPSPDIICSPLQQFYLPDKNCWVPAHKLQVGDVLLTEREGSIPIVKITFVEQQLDLYALKIECPHTFFVGRHSVLTHNMNLPIASLHWELPLTISTISTIGGLFTGFATAASGMAVGAIAASLIYSAVIDHKAKKYHKVEIPKDNILLFAQKQSNSPQPPQGRNNNNNSNQPQDPNGKKPRITDKVGNMYELFALNAFGKALEECSERTKFLYDNHARIFRIIKDSVEYGLKRGYLYYLDTLHYDHLEVFNKGGTRCVAVLNLDGSYNAAKTSQAIKQCRDIIEWIK